MKRKEIFWFAVVIMLCLFLLVFSACTLPGASGDGLMGAAGDERAVPATPFLEGEAVDYGDEMLILREVGAANGSSIDRIVVWLPPKVAQLSLSVNNNPAELSKMDDDYLIELKTPAAVVLLEFKDESGAVIKQCQLDMADVLSPAGDCIW